MDTTNKDNINLYLFKLIKSKKFDELFDYIKKNKDIDLDIYDENYNYLIQYLVMFNELDIVKFILENNRFNIRLDINLTISNSLNITKYCIR